MYRDWSNIPCACSNRSGMDVRTLTNQQGFVGMHTPILLEGRNFVVPTSTFLKGVVTCVHRGALRCFCQNGRGLRDPSPCDKFHLEVPAPVAHGDLVIGPWMWFHLLFHLLFGTFHVRA